MREEKEIKDLLYRLLAEQNRMISSNRSSSEGYRILCDRIALLQWILNYKQAKSEKYYAVAKGRKPGIYMSWAACKRQVAGYSNAMYKAFTNRFDAADYLEKNSEEKKGSPSDPQEELPWNE